MNTPSTSIRTAAILLSLVGLCAAGTLHAQQPGTEGSAPSQQAPGKGGDRPERGEKDGKGNRDDKRDKGEKGDKAKPDGDEDADITPGQREKHPRLWKAIRELRDARKYMNEAPDAFGGHKAAALAATDEAIKQLRLAIASAGGGDRPGQDRDRERGKDGEREKGKGKDRDKDDQDKGKGKGKGGGGDGGGGKGGGGKGGGGGGGR